MLNVRFWHKADILYSASTRSLQIDDRYRPKANIYGCSQACHTQPAISDTS